MHAEAFHTGKWTISVLREGEECLALEFLADRSDATKLKFIHLFKETTEHGPPKGKERFRHLENNIHEFKTYDGYRMFCFVDREERHIFLTHGSKKPSKKELKLHIRRSEEMRAQFLQDLEKEQA